MFSRNPAQVAFYRSSAWRRTRAAYLETRHHICERCGRPASIVHHRHHIDANNVDDTSITLNPDNLEALCQECHNREHFGQGVTAPGTKFDANGNLVSVGR